MFIAYIVLAAIVGLGLWGVIDKHLSLRGHWRSNSTRTGDARIGWSVALLAILLFLNVCFYYSLIGLELDIKYADKKGDVLTAKTHTIVAELNAEVLKCLTHEKTTYQLLKPENADVVLVQYPQLKTVEVISTLLAKISQYREEYYSFQMERIEYNRDLEWFDRNPLWLF